MLKFSERSFCIIPCIFIFNRINLCPFYGNSFFFFILFFKKKRKDKSQFQFNGICKWLFPQEDFFSLRFFTFFFKKQTIMDLKINSDNQTFCNISLLNKKMARKFSLLFIFSVDMVNCDVKTYVITPFK